jgi:hypothetical protein
MNPSPSAQPQPFLKETDREILQQIGSYLLARKGMRNSGFIGLGFGFLDLLASLESSSIDNPVASFLSLLLALLGLMLLINGIVLLRWPRRFALILCGICLILVGLWNLGIALLFGMEGALETAF